MYYFWKRIKDGKKCSKKGIFKKLLDNKILKEDYNKKIKKKLSVKDKIEEFFIQKYT